MYRHLPLGLVFWSIFVVAAPNEKMSTLEYIESLPQPALMGGVGNSHLEITTASKEAQAFFDQGVSLLHDFWWFEAYRAFRHTAQLDPEAAMPHWGLYQAASSMANLADDEREAALDEAVAAMKSLRSAASEREQYYLDAVIALHDNEGEAGVAEHNQILLALLNKYPEQIEARLFLWRELDVGFDAEGNPKPDQLYGQLLLEREFDDHGDHQGLLHYWIHSQEPGQHPETALEAARRLARLAPNSGHIVHMPGHIYYLMGDYASAHEQFVKAEQTDARYMANYNIEAIFTWNYLHNFSFIMSNLAEAGRLQEGAKYADKLAQLTETSNFRHLPHFEMLLSRAMMENAYMAIRLEQYDLAASLIRDSRWDDWEKTDRLLSLQSAYYAYSAGMAAVQAGDLASAETFSRQLDSTLWRAGRDTAGLSYRQKPLEVAALELQGLVEGLRGDVDAGIDLLQRAVELEAEIEYGEPRSNIHPAAESLATLLLQKGDFAAARAACQGVLAERPNAGMPLYGIARSYALAGDTREAEQAYKAFLKAWADADTDLPQVSSARAWLKAH